VSEQLDESAKEASLPEERQSSVIKYIAEAVLGVLIGALVLWVLIVSVSDVEFIYQGF